MLRPQSRDRPKLLDEMLDLLAHSSELSQSIGDDFRDSRRDASNPPPDRGAQGVSSSQKPIRRIAMLELIETIAAASGSIPERRRLDAGAFEKPCDPSLDRRSQSTCPLSTSGAISRTLSTQTSGSPVLPASVDQSTG